MRMTDLGVTVFRLAEVLMGIEYSRSPKRIKKLKVLFGLGRKVIVSLPSVAKKRRKKFIERMRSEGNKEDKEKRTMESLILAQDER